MKRLAKRIGCLFMVGALIVPEASAYVTVAWKWPTTNVVYYVNLQNQDVSTSAALNALQAGATVWHNQASIQVSLVYGGQVSDTAVNGTDRRNVVLFRPDNAGSTIASTYLWAQNGVLVDSDMIFYDAGWTFFTGTSGCVSGAYIEDIAAHEFGHMLGLDHSSVTTATMYPTYTRCETNFRSLDPDDIAGIESMYHNGVGTVDQPPSIAILSPSNGTTVSQGTSVTFTGSSNDVPDGNISNQIVWTSNIDGSLGTGASFSRTLSQGNHTVTATITDSIGYTMAQAIMVYVTAGGGGTAPPTISAQPQNRSVTAGQTAVFSISASGSNLTYQWASKPSGSSTFSNISGATGASYTTPATVLSDSGKQFRCTVSNSGGSVISNAATLTVSSSVSVPVITSGGTASGMVGSAFSYQITASNSPASFNATGLPSGLSINTGTGLISGTPTSAATVNVSLSATNTGGTGTKTLTITINPSASYSCPGGVTCDGTAVNGSPNQVVCGMYLYSYQCTSAGWTALGTPCTCGPPPPPAVPVISSAGTATGTVSSAFSYQITASNSPTSFSATGLPAGLSVNTATGLISGTPTMAATTNVTLSATNSGGAGTMTLTITINTSASYSCPGGSICDGTPVTGSPNQVVCGTDLRNWQCTASGWTQLATSCTCGTTPPPPPPPSGGVPTITSALSATGKVGTGFSYQITANNSPTNFGASGLAPGLSINSTTGAISGTPTTAGTYNVLLSASNSAGTGTALLTLTINPKKGKPQINNVTMSAQKVTGSVARFASMGSQVTLSEGSPTYILQATGSNFAPGDILNWNDSGISTTLADSTQLAAVLPGALVSGGTVKVQVRTPDGEVSEPFTFTIMMAQSDLSTVRVYPNPWRADRHGNVASITISGLPVGSTVKLFTVSGHVVRTLIESGGTASWDLLNNDGDKVASGTYFYMLQTDQGHKKTGQIVVIK